MRPDTHLGIDQRLCGVPYQLSPGRACATLHTVPEMAADDRGLVHGGFVFGLADHAAMLAINHPNVVLGAAQVRLLAPVRVGERLDAEAVVLATRGRRHQVAVTVRLGAQPVFAGEMTCFVGDGHVLDRRVAGRG